MATSPEYAFPYCGTIKRWDAKFMNKGTLRLQVWRHHKVMNYRLVQETPVYVTKGERKRERERVYSYQLFGGGDPASKVLFHLPPPLF